jgi:hypothetical protein
MAKGYEGAVALMQDSSGHCSLSALSYCTQGHVRRYFQTGELPPVNTTCAVDVLPFGDWYGPGYGDGDDDDAVEAAEEVRADRREWERMSEASLEQGTTPGGRALYRLHQMVRDRD